LDKSYLVKQLASNLVGLSARQQQLTLDEALETMRQEMVTEFQQRDFKVECQQKAIKLGISSRGSDK